MSADLSIVLGLEDKNFRRDLNRTGAYSKRQAWQIARDFERAEQARERETRAHLRRVNKVYRSSAVIIAASIGAIGAALRKAAEQDMGLANEMAAVRAEFDGLIVDVGRDLADTGMLGYFKQTLGVIREVRGALTDAAAFVMSGFNLTETREKARIEEEQKQRDAEARRARAAADIEARTFGEDPEQRRRRDLNKAINDAGLDPGRASALRQRLEETMEAERKDAARKEAEAEEKNRRDAQVRRMRQDADLAQARAARTGDAGDERTAAGLDYRARAAELEARILHDQTIPAHEKDLELRREMAILREQYLADLEKIEQAEQDRLQRAEREAATMERQLEIDLLRATGQEKEARRLETIARYEREVERIREMSAVSEERRARMLEQAERIRDAGLAELDKPERSQTIGFAGLAGGDTLLRQVMGGSNNPAASTAKNTAKMVQILEKIERKAGVAVAG